jgi:hypothetical protein
MARIVLHVGAVLVVLGATTRGVQAEQPEIPADVQAAADEAGVDAVDLLGALNSLHEAGISVSPAAYLCTTDGLLCPDPPPVRARPVATSGRVACIVRVESHGNPNATNPRTGAAGLGQFVRSTWLTTPQGKAGYSPYNAAANEAAIAWMLANGRAREFVAVSAGYC